MKNPTEQTALLYTLRPPATPLPRFQVFILLMMRITEPISYTVIFPFINQMMEEVAHIPKAKVGYYAGLVESAFALVQFLFVYQWGALSDRVGRRVVALTGLGGVLISVLGFGLSKNLGMMIVTRCIAGAMNGNVAVVKTIIFGYFYLQETLTPHWVYPLGSRMVWVVLGSMVAAKTIICNSLLINNSAPSRDSLGSLNGITQSASSLARSFGPAGVTTLFALSNEYHLLGGQLVHIVLVGIALVTLSLTMRLENVQPAWRKPPPSFRRDLDSSSGSTSVSTSPS
ncbi:hypothetical protein K435DRAFT_844804 [Dendrothele bispora CBS 962.96]|uniref:Major facilitator superfamily (MFS) profile domain-containing protein n=1 Tax=Dendrothele bispora (strain CBS 962.96) TaxID=1314807 RepID=A0A4S8KZ95_DENBC|nr:hypothetical protein K435DRAFT_844804 [Dendrothele bispora CBS 962.96]